MEALGANKIKQKIFIRDGRAPVPKNEQTSRVMSAIRAKNTTPERILRKELLSKGLNRYRLHPKNVPGRPDITFSKKKVAVFVHGCFWHGCSHCKLKLPKTNRKFWRDKINRNKLRDKRKTLELRKLGWKVVTVWEHDIKSGKSKDVGARIKKILSTP